ncbi:hypothetical protein MMC11_001904 [Xylographa trunciseda]|nr:hypothetical protein [Xylographa trunciseda]
MADLNTSLQSMPMRFELPSSQGSCRSFPFLRLPPELRNKIYDLVLKKEYFIHWLVKNIDLTYITPSCPHTPRPGSKMATHRHELRRQFPEMIIRRRNLHSSRVETIEHSTSDHIVPPGPAALLFTCNKISTEATSVLYGHSAFHFANRSVLNMFVSSLRPSTKVSVKAVRVLYDPTFFRGGFPESLWEAKDQQLWTMACQNMASELKGLEELTIQAVLYYLRYSDVSPPLDAELFDAWANPWLTMRGCGLKCVDIFVTDPGYGVQGGRMTTWQLKRELLGGHGDPQSDRKPLTDEQGRIIWDKEEAAALCGEADCPLRKYYGVVKV